MEQRDEVLVSNELVESILLGIGTEPERELLQIYNDCGYVREYKTMFHPAVTVRCMIERLVSYLYRDQPRRSGLIRIGERMVEGHTRTFDAQFWLSKAIQMTQDEAFESIISYFRIVPAARTHLTRYGDHHYGLLLSGWPLQPEVVLGSLSAIIAGLGNNEVQAEFLVNPEPDSYSFTFQWRSDGTGLLRRADS